MGHSVLLSVRNTWAGVKSVHRQKPAHQETYDASLESTHTLWDQSPLLGWDTKANFTDSDNRENQAVIIFQSRDMAQQLREQIIKRREKLPNSWGN